MKKVILAMCLLITGLFVGCGSDSKDKVSNQVVIYSPNADDEVNALIPPFEKATGIKVILQSMGTGDCLARIDAEKENPQADINWGAINLPVYKTHPDLWEKYVSPNEKNLPDQFKTYNGYFTNYKLSGSGALLINKDVLKSLGLKPEDIKGYKDLLRPELKGKIAMGDPTASSSAFAELTNMLLVMSEKPYSNDAWDYVDKFIKQLNGNIISSSSQIYRATADGEYAVGVSYEDPCISLIQNGADNLEVVYPEEGAVWLPAGVAIVKNAQNKENAQKFIDFLISDEGQKILANTTIRPANTNIPNGNKYLKPFSDIKQAYEDIEYCADNKNDIQEKWTKLIINQ